MKRPRGKRYPPLSWKVFVEDYNHGKIVEYDIMGEYLSDEIKGIIKKVESYEEFKERLNSILMYHFWSKCEWEVIITGWPPSERVEERKVDVYEQIKLNFEVFAKYIWDSWTV